MVVRQGITKNNLHTFMIISKKVTMAGGYVKKKPYDYEGKKFDADVKNGDIVTILSSGDIVEGQFGPQHVFKLSTRNGEKNANFNQGTLNTLHDAFGKNSEGWVNKEVSVHLVKVMVSGKMQTAMYLAPLGWAMDDEGRFVNPEASSPAPSDYPEDEYPGEEIPM